MLTEASLSTAIPRATLTEASWTSAAPTGMLTEALITSGSTGPGSVSIAGSWVDVDASVSIGGQWQDVDAVLSVNGQWVEVGPGFASTDPSDPNPPVDPPDPNPSGTRGPVQFTTVDDARAFLGAPADANYVVWDPAWDDQGLMLHDVFTTKLSANDILVLPERVDAQGVAIPYLIDSSKGFMAAGVSWITGQLPSDTAATRIPITPNPRCWFEMARGRRGILGMGPKAVIQPSVSSFSRPAQPITEQTGGTMAAYNAAGTKLQDLVGAQDCLMRFDHANPFVGNVTFRSRDMGGVAYSTIAAGTVVNVRFEASSRGHAGVPNGETGSILTNNVAVRIENVEIVTTDSTGTRVVTSPIMLNRNSGGIIKNVKIGRPRAGMLTFWRCTGTYTLTDVTVDGQDVALNLEEGGPGFVINWTGGSISTQGSYHVVGEASAGSKKLKFNDLTVAGGSAAATNGLALHFYSYTNTAVQKRSDVTRNNGPLNFYGSFFIA